MGKYYDDEIKFRAQLKKLRRQRKRQDIAKLRDLNDAASEEHSAVIEATKLADEELQKEKEERDRERLHLEWLERERKAQEEFERQKCKEERIRLDKEEKERKLREEWEELQRKEKEEKARLDAEIQEKKDREAALLKEATEHLTDEGKVWNNPAPPPNFGSEMDKQNCPFFVKTGACRFGERCSRAHPRPAITQTILIPGMFSHFSLDKAMRDEFDSDMSLEYEDNECYLHFREFYFDVLPEFKKAGHVTQFKVCRNYESHLRGNVYVQYETEEEAMEAFKMFNGRFYAGKQLSCEFTAVTKWKSAICGLYHQNRCPKGKNCNFLHVFFNPNNEYYDADRDILPRKEIRERRSKRSFTSSDRRSPSSHDRHRRSRDSERSRGRRSDSRNRDSRRKDRRQRSRSREKRSRRYRDSGSRSRTRTADSDSGHSHTKSHRKKSKKSYHRSRSRIKPRDEDANNESDRKSTQDSDVLEVKNIDGESPTVEPLKNGNSSVKHSSPSHSRSEHKKSTKRSSSLSSSSSSK